MSQFPLINYQGRDRFIRERMAEPTEWFADNRQFKEDAFINHDFEHLKGHFLTQKTPLLFKSDKVSTMSSVS